MSYKQYPATAHLSPDFILAHAKSETMKYQHREIIRKLLAESAEGSSNTRAGILEPDERAALEAVVGVGE